MPEVREQIISLAAVTVRYGGYVAVGIGLALLRKWSAYLWAILMVLNLGLVFTIYGGKTIELKGALALLPWVGPILIVAFFYYVWPALKPMKLRANQSVA